MGLQIASRRVAGHRMIEELRRMLLEGRGLAGPASSDATDH